MSVDNEVSGSIAFS